MSDIKKLQQELAGASHTLASVSRFMGSEEGMVEEAIEVSVGSQDVAATDMLDGYEEGASLLLTVRPTREVKTDLIEVSLLRSEVEKLVDCCGKWLRDSGKKIDGR